MNAICNPRTAKYASLILAYALLLNSFAPGALASRRATVLASSLALTEVAPPPVTDGLVSWWRADGNASDYFGVNNGTFESGALYDAGRMGQAFRFNGTSNFVKVPNSTSLNPGSQVTLEFWMKADTGNLMNSCCQGLMTTDYYHVEVSGGNDPRVGVNFMTNTGSGYRHTSDGNGGGFVLEPRDGWHHVAATYGDGLMSLYVDGQLKQTNTQFNDILPMLPGDFFSIGSE